MTKHRFEVVDIGLGEEGSEGGAAHAVVYIVDGGEAGVGETKLRDVELVFVAGFVHRVEFVVVVRLVNVEFIRADSDYWACEEGG
jgi:hypothetical protein